MIGKWRSSDGNVISVRSEHEVEESSGSAETGVEIRTRVNVGGMSSGETVDSSCGVGDDGGDSDKRRAGSIGVGR